MCHGLKVTYQAVDALSRIFTNGENMATSEDAVPCLGVCDAEEDLNVEGEYVESCELLRRFVGHPEVMATAEEENQVLPITIKELLKEQNTDSYCKEAHTKVEHTTFIFDIERECFLGRHARLDGALQKAVPVHLRA